MRLDISRTESRLGLVGLAAFGLTHFLAPRSLLRAARSAYGLTLDVEFVAREGAPRRVRLVGLCTLVASAIGWKLLGRTDGDRIRNAAGPTPEPPQKRPDDD